MVVVPKRAIVLVQSERSAAERWRSNPPDRGGKNETRIDWLGVGAWYTGDRRKYDGIPSTFLPPHIAEREK